MFRRTLLRAAMAVALASFVSQSPVMAGVSSSCETGKTAGAWDLPAAGQAGSVDGVLEFEGRPRFRLRARLLPRPAASTAARRRGDIEGALVLFTPAGPMPFARVSGKWSSDAKGEGKFKAVVYRPGSTAGAPSQLLGEIGGKFKDSSRTDPGRYHGRWKICR